MEFKIGTTKIAFEDKYKDYYTLMDDMLAKAVDLLSKYTTDTAFASYELSKRLGNESSKAAEYLTALINEYLKYVVEYLINHGETDFSEENFMYSALGDDGESIAYDWFSEEDIDEFQSTLLDYYNIGLGDPSVNNYWTYTLSEVDGFYSEINSVVDSFTFCYLYDCCDIAYDVACILADNGELSIPQIERKFYYKIVRDFEDRYKDDKSKMIQPLLVLYTKNPYNFYILRSLLDTCLLSGEVDIVKEIFSIADYFGIMSFVSLHIQNKCNILDFYAKSYNEAKKDGDKESKKYQCIWLMDHVSEWRKMKIIDSDNKFCMVETYPETKTYFSEFIDGRIMQNYDVFLEMIKQCNN